MNLNWLEYSMARTLAQLLVKSAERTLVHKEAVLMEVLAKRVERYEARETARVKVASVK